VLTDCCSEAMVEKVRARVAARAAEGAAAFLRMEVLRGRRAERVQDTEEVVGWRRRALVAWRRPRLTAADMVLVLTKGNTTWNDSTQWTTPIPKKTSWIVPVDGVFAYLNSNGSVAARDLTVQDPYTEVALSGGALPSNQQLEARTARAEEFLPRHAEHPTPSTFSTLANPALGLSRASRSVPVAPESCEVGTGPNTSSLRQRRQLTWSLQHGISTCCQFPDVGVP